MNSRSGAVLQTCFGSLDANFYTVQNLQPLFIENRGWSSSNTSSLLSVTYGIEGSRRTGDRWRMLDSIQALLGFVEILALSEMQKGKSTT